MQTGPLTATTEEGQAVESTLSSSAKQAMESRRFERCFVADWCGLTFLHFEVKAALLGEVVPFPLDLHEGRAFVSLVCFTMRRFRFARSGRFTSWLTAPLATQRFLNLRTYVRGPLGPGIFFMHEWLDHALAVRLGPSTFGLPYRRGRLSYQNDKVRVAGRIVADGAEGFFSGVPGETEHVAASGSLEEFLQERYVAYTGAGLRPLAFRVWHEPWRCRRLDLRSFTMDSFLHHLGQPWTANAEFVGASHAADVIGVWMGRPHRARFGEMH